MLARLHRAGELRAIYVPDDTDEAMRDLVRRARRRRRVGTQAKYRLKAFLLRQGRRYPGREGWTLPYRRWLTDLSFPVRRSTSRCRNTRRDRRNEQRIDRLTEQLRQLAPTWRWAPVVAALQALRGVSFLTAVALVAELGDLTRFGIHASSWRISGSCRRNIRVGPVVRRGAITKAGNPMCDDCSPSRRGRIKDSPDWTAACVPAGSLPKVVCDIAWKAQLRLTTRFRRLVARGKAKPKVATAIARELSAFVWAIAREVSPTPR